MFRRSLLAGLTLALVLACLQPLAAGDPPTAPGAKPEGISRPDEIAGLFTPEPLDMLGWRDGPCTISINCRFGNKISCSGQDRCVWYNDQPTSIHYGYVECDGIQTSCEPGA